MSRSRNLKPLFFKNESLAELPFEYRLLFQGLWCLADREGRLENRPKRIKAEVFPYDDVDVVDGLHELARCGFIRLYEVGGGKYIEVAAFLKHQHPHCKEAASTIPAPCSHGASTTKGDQPSRASTSSDIVPSGASPALTLNPLTETLNPEPVTLNPDSPSGEKRKAPAVDEGQVAAVYAAYPRKVARHDALKAIRTALQSVPFDVLLPAVQEYARSREGKDPNYTPHPATWFNRRRWEDDRAEWWRDDKPAAGLPPPRVPSSGGRTGAVHDYMAKYGGANGTG